MKVRVTAAVLLTVLLGMVACGEKATPETVATGTDAPAATATPEPTATDWASC